jgi:type VI secretion system secreted protein VgrG
MSSILHRYSLRITALVALGAASLAPAASLGAQTALGTAQPFGVLGSSTVTNTGPTTVVGNLGVSPGSALTTTGGLIVTGTTNVADAVAAQAQRDAALAYGVFAGLPFTSDLTGMNLGGMTLTPGVYSFESSAQLTGNLFLNFLGNPEARFVFQIGSTLTTASSSGVFGLDGLFGPNVFFQVGSSATLGTTTAFRGSILANESITLTTGATINCGRAIALTGAVTMDHNVVSTLCAAAEVPPVTTVPEPSTLALMLAPLALVGVMARRRAVAREAAAS